MSFIDDLKESWTYLKHNVRGEKVVFDYYLQEISRLQPPVHEMRRFTKQKGASLRAQGYLKAEKWLEELTALGMPVYVKFHNFPEVDAAAYGNLETSSTLHDWYKSNCMSKWYRGFTKISFDPLDTKTIIGVAVVILGLGGGFFLLFGGGF